jgi:hypothetical protein
MTDLFVAKVKIWHYFKNEIIVLTGDLKKTKIKMKLEWERMFLSLINLFGLHSTYERKHGLWLSAPS